MRRFFLVLTIITFSIISVLNAQPWKRAPLELFGGISNFHYFGDVGGSPSESNLLGLKDISFRKIRPGVHLGARYQISKPFHLKAGYSFGFLTQSDANSRNENRNYAFRTLVNEFTIQAEYYIIPESDENYYYSIMQVRGGLRHFRQPLSLYLTGGVGGVHFSVTPFESLIDSPRFSDDESFAMVIPIGIGAKYAIMPKISLGAELIGRYTTTNKLDGFASPSGQYNDIYYSFILKINYKIQKTRRAPLGVPRRRFFNF